jgi:hypothetical protein
VPHRWFPHWVRSGVDVKVGLVPVSPLVLTQHRPRDGCARAGSSAHVASCPVSVGDGGYRGMPAVEISATLARASGHRKSFCAGACGVGCHPISRVFVCRSCVALFANSAWRTRQELPARIVSPSSRCNSGLIFGVLTRFLLACGGRVRGCVPGGGRCCALATPRRTASPWCRVPR